MNVFDRAQVRRHRERAARSFGDYDFLHRAVAERLADRLQDVTRRFPRALCLGSQDGTLARALTDRGGIEGLVQCDLSPAMAAAARRARQPSLAADEEALPFAPNSFDLIVSLLNLHWVNDLPGALVQIRHCLKPDGLFLAALLGGETLRELRTAVMEAEIAEEQGASPRVSPFADLRDAGGLLQRAGLALPVVDLDSITVTYPDAFRLMRDLRGMGETNAVHARRRTVSRRATLFRAAQLYQAKFADADGRLPATFQVIFLTAWAPHEAQPKAMRPGTAQARLSDALGGEEISTGEKAAPDRGPSESR